MCKCGIDVVGTSRFKNTLKPVPAGPAECVYQTCYGHTGQHQAVIVWSDGSATAQYASEGVAVSVDPDRTGMVPSHESTEKRRMDGEHVIQRSHLMPCWSCGFLAAGMSAVFSAKMLRARARWAEQSAVTENFLLHRSHYCTDHTLMTRLKLCNAHVSHGIDLDARM